MEVLESKLLAWIREHGEVDGIELDRETNLMDEAIVDSVAFLELFEYVESLTGNRLDVMEIEDLDELTTVSRLSAYVCNEAE